MDQVSTDWRAAIGRLDGAYSPNTLRAYRADFELFERWCHANAKIPLPASPASVAEFISSRAAFDASTTLKRRLSGVRKVHRLLKLPNPVDDEDVAISLRRALRQKRRRPKQALGLTSQILNEMLDACDDSLTGLRNRAMLQVGYDTLCRRSELVALCLEDLRRTSDGGAQILIRRSKTDPFGDGRIGRISAQSMRALDQWIQAAGIKEGGIFRRINGSIIGADFLHPFTINRTIKSLAIQAGYTAEFANQLSGHSLRIGAAQDLMSSGRDVVAIMKAGGWRSINVVARYIEAA